MRLRLAFNSPERDQNTHGASPFILNWLDNREHILNSLLSNLDGMAYCCLPDKDWTMLYISEGCMQLTGYSSDEFLTSGGITYEEITYPEDRTKLRDAINAAIKDNRRYDVEYRIIRSNGAIRWVAERGQSIVNTEGRLEAIEGFIQDITEKKASEQAIIEAEKRYRSIFENTVEGIFQTTPDGRYLSANPALAKIYGYNSADELIGSLNNIEEQLYVDKNKRREFSQLMQLSERVTNFESQVYRKNGSIIWISENARTVRDHDGKLIYYEGTVEDITVRRENTALIEYQATHDDLTGLPNRALLKDRLHQAIRSAERSDSQLAIVFVDLDQFKDVNDSMGHHAGDKLLITMAERLKSCVRESDTVARPGGDEFVLLLSNLHSLDSLSQMLQRILETTAEPCNIDGREFVVTCSLGISMFPEDGKDSDTLLKHADNAMYKAKHAGKNNFQFYTKELNALLLERLELEYHLRHAIKNNEFELFFQPKASLSSGKLTGIEALIRWNSPIHGLVSPAKFIPVAEESALIEQIGEWVLEESCNKATELYRATGEILPVSINVSPRQFYNPKLITMIDAVLARTGLHPSCLEIEITEGTLVNQTSKFTTVLKNLKALGIKLAIDDFGTGYSSMGYLKNFPIDNIKIDQSFVRDLEIDRANQAILRAIVALGKNLGLNVIAEGIETQLQKNFLAAIGCDQIQGYLLSKPLPMKELVAFVIASKDITE